MPQLTATSYDRRYYDEHRAAGLDYAVYGDWQQRYGKWIIDGLGMRSRVVLDVGCACGAIAYAMWSAGAFTVRAIDLCETMIAIGRERFKEVVFNVCDAANLHPFGDDCFDFVHSAQVAEHWKPELVPHILDELYRVTRAGGLFFVCLDTVELFERQGRNPLNEDPTHVAIFPQAWWLEQLAAAGWEDETENYHESLEASRRAVGIDNDWDYFVLRKP